MSDIDGFTAGLFLGAAMNGASPESIMDLKKSLESPRAGGPTQEAIDFFEKNKGKKCKVRFTSYTGIIHDLNRSSGGIYNGERFPIYVLITGEGRAKNRIFEYELDQVEVIEE